MVTAIEPLLREQLIDRRHKLEDAASAFHRPAELTRLLQEVDAALDRMDIGTYGLCEVCHDPVETERLIADPLTRFCLGDLTPREQRALEEDLELAAQIQTGLLPAADAADRRMGSLLSLPAGRSGQWRLLRSDQGRRSFATLRARRRFGQRRGGVDADGPSQRDVSHLDFDQPAARQMVERASRVFCESTLPTQYATLVCGRATNDGDGGTLQRRDICRRCWFRTAKSPVSPRRVCRSVFFAARVFRSVAFR